MCSVLLKCNLTLTHTLLEVSTLIIGVIVTMVTRHHEMSFSPDDNWLKFSAKHLIENS